jgi:hypothetical protein
MLPFTCRWISNKAVVFTELWHDRTEGKQSWASSSEEMILSIIDRVALHRTYAKCAFWSLHNLSHGPRLTCISLNEITYRVQHDLPDQGTEMGPVPLLAQGDDSLVPFYQGLHQNRVLCSMIARLGKLYRAQPLNLSH